MEELLPLAVVVAPDYSDILEDSLEAENAAIGKGEGGVGEPLPTLSLEKGSFLYFKGLFDAYGYRFSLLTTV